MASTFTPRDSRVVSARLTLDQFRSVTAAAKLAGNTLSDHVRLALASVAHDAPESDQEEWFAIAEALGMDPQAVDAMVAALEEIIDTVRAANPPPESADPSASAADAPVASALSKHELAACKKHNMDPVEYVIRKRTAVRRAGDAPAPATLSASVGTLSLAERAACRKAGMSEAEFTERKASAVRRPVT